MGSIKTRSLCCDSIPDGAGEQRVTLKPGSRGKAPVFLLISHARNGGLAEHPQTLRPEASKSLDHP